jgi:hypothetical protein
MTAENKLCGGKYPCEGKTTGVCDIAQEIFRQAEKGGLPPGNKWPKRQWEGYLQRNRREVLPICEKPEQLRYAIATAAPRIIENEEQVRP